MRNIKLLLFGFISLPALISCGKPAKQNAAFPPTPVNVVEARKADAVYYDQYQGTVVALNSGGTAQPGIGFYYRYIF